MVLMINTVRALDDSMPYGALRVSCLPDVGRLGPSRLNTCVHTHLLLCEVLQLVHSQPIVASKTSADRAGGHASAGDAQSIA
jgi:hypothetical protein